jgi:sulfopropanediol 3-dehydrogenase
MHHLKKPQRSAEEDDRRTREVVDGMLADIESRGEIAVREYAEKFDGWTGDFLLGEEKKARLIEQVPQQVKDDIRFAHDQVTRFAQAQKASLAEFEASAWASACCRCSAPAATCPAAVTPMRPRPS